MIIIIKYTGITLHTSCQNVLPIKDWVAFLTEQTNYLPNWIYLKQYLFTVWMLDRLVVIIIPECPPKPFQIWLLNECMIQNFLTFPRYQKQLIKHFSLHPLEGGSEKLVLNMTFLNLQSWEKSKRWALYLKNWASYGYFKSWKFNKFLIFFCPHLFMWAQFGYRSNFFRNWFFWGEGEQSSPKHWPWEG